VPPGTGPPGTGPLDPEESPGFLLWHVTLRWQREITAALAPLGLTHVQFVLLASSWWLNAHGADPNQLSVARQAGTDVKMTSEVLRRLEAKGLIVRTVDAADTRARRIQVTERGGELAQAAVTAVEGVDAAFFAAVPDPGALLAMLRPLARGNQADIPDP
jgi:DNA-binding MarR family transcriptional regulator